MGETRWGDGCPLCTTFAESEKGQTTIREIETARAGILGEPAPDWGDRCDHGASVETYPAGGVSPLNVSSLVHVTAYAHPGTGSS